MTTYLAAFLAACGLSLILTPIVVAICKRYELFDHPFGSRKIHSRSIPHLGGIAVFVAFYVPLAAVMQMNHDLAATLRAHAGSMGAFFVASLLILALGIFDDLRGASASLKFPVQILAALILYHQGGIRIDVLYVPFVGELHQPWLGLPLTLLWIVGITNAINLIDGIDGLASGVGLFASATVFVLCLNPVGYAGRVLPALYMATLAGALLGFIRYNFSPATIFLGDSGSLFIGFAIATFSIQASQKSSSAVALLVPIVVLGLPIFDTFLAMLRRYVRGDSMFSADRQHIHHRLLDLGLSTPSTVLILYGVCVALSLIGLGVVYGRDRDTALLLLLLGVVAFVGARKLGYSHMILTSLRQGSGLLPSMRATYSPREVRRLEAELEVATTVDDLWARLSAGLASDFDRAELTLLDTGDGTGANPPTYVWERSLAHETMPDQVRVSWSAEVPLAMDDRVLAKLVLGRDLDRPRPLPGQRGMVALGRLVAEHLDRVSVASATSEVRRHGTRAS